MKIASIAENITRVCIQIFFPRRVLINSLLLRGWRSLEAYRYSSWYLYYVCLDKLITTPLLICKYVAPGLKKKSDG